MTYNKNKGSHHRHNPTEESLDNLIKDALSEKPLYRHCGCSFHGWQAPLVALFPDSTAREEPAAAQSIENHDQASKVVIASIDAETRFDVASMTKPLSTSLLILKALQAGALDLKDPLGKYLPELNYKTGQIPILALLTHQRTTCNSCPA